MWDPDDDTYEVDIGEKLMKAWEVGKWKVKINVSVGCILRRANDDHYRYFHSSSNNACLFKNPRLINSSEGLQSFIDDVTSIDLEQEGVKRRPNTEWRLHALTNMTFYMYKLKGMSRVGGGVVKNLPDYIKMNRSLLSLDANPHTGEIYEDHFCFFRCLDIAKSCRCAVGKCKCKTASERRVKIYLNEFLEKKNIDVYSFEGVGEDDLMTLEELFDVRITVFELQADKSSSVLWRSHRKVGTVLNVNLYESHFSYIRNLTNYTNSFECSSCEQCFTRASSLNRHDCDVERLTRFIIPGGAFSPRKTVFDRLKSDAGIEVPDNLRYYPYRITYDIETFFNKDPTRLPHGGETTTYISEHEFMSVSICSNVPGYCEPVCFVRDVETTVDECVQRFIDYALEIASKAGEIMSEKFSTVNHRLHRVVTKRERKEKKFAEAGFSSPRVYNSRRDLCSLPRDLYGWQHEVPIVGFNSQRYDLNVMKGAMVKAIDKSEESIDFVVKKMESMACMKTKRLKFVDISNFIAPGFSYDKYLQAYGIEQRKGYFPYEWVDDLNKLNETTLPDKEAFYSSLKNRSITDEEYAIVDRAWRENQMKTVRDLLVWYNNLDVSPFLEALEKQSSIYQQKGIDMLKEAISLPGLSTLWMFNVIGSQPSLRDVYDRLDNRRDRLSRLDEAMIDTRVVHLFDKNNKDLFDLFKRNTVGGPSIVFHRYHEKGVTRLRSMDFGEEARYCQRIMGVDANALYLYCVMGRMPVGIPRRRHEKNDFVIEEAAQLRGKMAQGWLGWVELTTANKLETAMSGGERRLGRHNLPVDGFCEATNTVYQFHGCYWHGHDCSPRCDRIIRGRTSEERRQNTADKEKYLRTLGYTVVSIWECQWRQRVSESDDIKSFLKIFFRRAFGDKRGMTLEEALTRIKTGRIFGFVECDIKVPDSLIGKFTEMPPIFKNVDLSREHLTDHMRNFAEENDHLARPQRSLIGSMRGDKILLFTDLLQWYLEHGLEVTRIYQIIEYEGREIFRQFGDSVTEARRAGDVDASQQLLANTAKLIGNSLYGKTITDKTRHRRVTYTTSERTAASNMRSQLFQSLNELDGNVYETTFFKKTV